MELVAPSATTQPPMTTETTTPDSPATAGVAPVRLVRTALLGLLGTAAVVGGSLMGGSSFETHLPWGLVLRDARRHVRVDRIQCDRSPQSRRWRSCSAA